MRQGAGGVGHTEGSQAVSEPPNVTRTLQVAVSVQVRGCGRKVHCRVDRVAGTCTFL